MFVKCNTWQLVYDNEDGGDPGEGGDLKPKEKPTLKSLIETHGLQDELNGMMATNRKSLAQKNTELATQLRTLGDEATMSTQSRDELAEKIEQLELEHMSDKERANHAAGKTAKDHAKQLESLTTDAAKWQGLYANSTTQQALMDAAIGGEALPLAVSQIVSILGPNTRIVEEIDAAGNGVGRYKTVVKFNDTNDDGEAVTLDLSPAEAVKRMKELPQQWGNLFKGENAGGLGSAGGATGGDAHPRLSEILSRPGGWKKYRAEKPDLDIESLRK